MLRLPSTLPRARKRHRVDELLNDLGLTKSQHTLIGCVSGGERKRLALATALLTNPSLLLCDEPTSGLDSYMAESVVRLLREMVVKTNKTVICTIHQPPNEVYMLFDVVMLLADGKLAYMGAFICPHLKMFSECFR
jgi:ABC-type multidrug transport system ATPase subunit